MFPPHLYHYEGQSWRSFEEFNLAVTYVPYGHDQNHIIVERPFSTNNPGLTYEAAFLLAGVANECLPFWRCRIRRVFLTAVELDRICACRGQQ